MVVLWGAIKSVLKPNDKVVSVCNGLYGDGFAEMAQMLGANVVKVEFPWTSRVDNDRVIEVIRTEQPKLVTMVHCETPTGCLNDLTGIGLATRENNGLFLVDFVSSGAGVELNVDEECIDLGLLGPQKVLSAPPALGFASVSERAWDVISTVSYVGYDAFGPFKGAKRGKLLPYTHNWHAIAATRRAVDDLIREGLPKVYARHVEARDACLARAAKMGLQRYHKDCPSPTVSAFWVPDGVDWKQLDGALREEGMAVGGCYCHLSEKVFRIGHMGNQASVEAVHAAMDVLERVLETSRNQQ